MSLNSQVFPAHVEHSGRIKHLALKPASSDPVLEYQPCFYVEARIDFSDIRSGYHLTCGMNSVLDMVPLDGDLLWTRDMVGTVNPDALQTGMPEGARLRNLPDFVTEDVLSRIETRYLSFLLRHAEARVFRNFDLNIYSQPGETRGDFQTRCLEVFNESFRADLDAMREVINRRLERIEQKYLGQDAQGEFESERRMAQARSRLHAVAERIAELFLQTELTLEGEPAALAHPTLSSPDLEQRLETVETNVRREIRRLLNCYREKVLNIDEYIIHPDVKDLHLVRSCILWMPVEAQAR
jgi:hypothetical protein